MQDDDGWGHVDEPHEWFPGADEETALTAEEDLGPRPEMAEPGSSQDAADLVRASADGAGESGAGHNGHEASVASGKFGDWGSAAGEIGDGAKPASMDVEDCSASAKESPMLGAYPPCASHSNSECFLRRYIGITLCAKPGWILIYFGQPCESIAATNQNMYWIPMQSMHVMLVIPNIL
jgi:hypothetical protein